MLSLPYSIIVGVGVGLANCIHILSLLKNESFIEKTNNHGSFNNIKIQLLMINLSVFIYTAIIHFLYVGQINSGLIIGGIVDIIMVILFVIRGVNLYVVIETCKLYQLELSCTMDNTIRGLMTGLALGDATSIFALYLGCITIYQSPIGLDNYANILAYSFLFIGILIMIGMFIMKNKIFGFNSIGFGNLEGIK